MEVLFCVMSLPAVAERVSAVRARTERTLLGVTKHSGWRVFCRRRRHDVTYLHDGVF